MQNRFCLKNQAAWKSASGRAGERGGALGSHLAATGFFMESAHPTEGRLREMTRASHWSGADAMPHRPAPNLGEHSAEILREAGYGDAEIKHLAATGATRLA